MFNRGNEQIDSDDAVEPFNLSFAEFEPYVDDENDQSVGLSTTTEFLESTLSLSHDSTCEASFEEIDFDGGFELNISAFSTNTQEETNQSFTELSQPTLSHNATCEVSFVEIGFDDSFELNISAFSATTQEETSQSLTELLEPTLSHNATCEVSFVEIGFDDDFELNIPTFSTNTTQEEASQSLSDKKDRKNTKTSSIEYAQSSGASFAFFAMLENECTKLTQEEQPAILTDNTPAHYLEINGSIPFDRTTPLEVTESTPYQNQLGFQMNDTISPIFASGSDGFLHKLPAPDFDNLDIFASTEKTAEDTDNEFLNALNLVYANPQSISFFSSEEKSCVGDPTKSYHSVSEDQDKKTLLDFNS